MRIQAGMALMCLMAANVHAAPITQLQSDTTYDLRADGTYTFEQFTRVRVEDPQAIRIVGQMPLQYSESLQSLEILEAYTTTRDGKRIDVTPDKIRDQQSPESSRAPMFSDRKVKTMIFPQVEVGATITSRWRRTQLKPDFAGFFSMWETVGRVIDLESETVTLRAPASLALQIDTRGVDGGAVDNPAPGMHEWRWSFKPVKGQPAEPRELHRRDTSPYVMASTYSSYDQLAAAYNVRSALMAKPSAEVRKLADEITAGIKDKRAQARALYGWVSANIRYVSIVLDHGGYVPHASQDILAARYGDCKDHVTLLEALLAAKKIRSSAALVQSTDSYFVPKTVVIGAFNHAITYLPDFDLFVDSTPGMLPFGVLTPNEAGKQALVIDNGRGKAELRTLPMPNARDDWVVSRVDFTVSEDGTVTGTTSGESAGLYEANERQAVSAIPQDQLPQFVNRMLGTRGTGTMQASDPRDLARPFTYSATVDMPKYVKLPGPGATAQPSGIGRFGGTMMQFLQIMSNPTRTQPMACPGAGRRTEIAQFRLPPGLKVTSVPESVKQAVKFGAYESKYERNGEVIVSTRTLTLEYPGAVCSAEDYAQLRDLATAMRQDVRAQIVYE